MGKLIKNLFFQTPFILGLLFITLTAGRVHSFAGEDFRSLIFAIGLTMSVYVCAFLLGWKTTRLAALFALLFFVVMDGFFNLAETLRWSVEVGRWNEAISFTDGFDVYIYRFTDVPYGLFPTVAAILLGILAQRSEQLAGSVGIPTLRSLGSWIGLEPSDSRATPSDVPAIAERHECPHCDYIGDTRYHLSGHMSKHKNGTEPVKEAV